MHVHVVFAVGLGRLQIADHKTLWLCERSGQPRLAHAYGAVSLVAR